MTGASVYSFTVQQGPLTPVWWLFFQVLDACLFVFFALVFLGVGLGRRRSAWAVLRPVALVGVPGLLILFSTVDEQRFNAGLLRDWHRTYGGGREYLDWRREWVDTGLRPEAVRDFLAVSEAAPVERMPGLGAVRALAFVRLGDREAAQLELNRALEALDGHPGPVRIDLVRRVGVSALEEHLLSMRARIGEGEEGLGPVAPPGPADFESEWFPYESVLLRNGPVQR